MGNISRISDKIKFFSDFKKKYPDFYLSCSFEELSNLYCNTIEERDNLYSKLRTIFDYYTYLKSRRSKGKLSASELLELKKLNIGGVFGFSDEVEELAKKYNILEIYAVEVIKKGGIDKLYERFRKKEELESYEEDLLYKIINNSSLDIDYDNKYPINYNLLVKEIYGIRKNDIETLFFFSSKKIDEVIDTFNDKEKEIFIKRYGLKDGKCRTLDELSKEYNLSRERIRQMTAILVNKIRRIDIDKNMFIFKIDDMFDKLNISEEEKAVFKYSESKIFLSKNKEEIDTAKKQIRRFILDKDGNFKTEITIKKEQGIYEEIKPEDIEIRRLKLRQKTYYVLLRAGLKTLGDIIKCEELLRIRNLGRDKYEEILDMIHSYGLKHISEPELVDIEEKYPNKEDIPIELVGFSTRVMNGLRRWNLKTLGDVARLKSLGATYSLGSVSFQEIIDKLAEYGLELNEKAYKVIKPKIKKNKKTENKQEESVEVLKTETEEKSKLLDEYIELEKQHAKLKETESKLDEEIKSKEEILKKFGYKIKK